MPSNWIPTFRMKQFSKADYNVMKGFITQYDLKDPSQLFTALLHLAVLMPTLTVTDTDNHSINGATLLSQLISET